MGKAYSRSCTVLIPGRWQDWLVNKIWTHRRLKCGFNFKSNKFDKDGMSGVIRGCCKCGSALHWKVENEDGNEYVTINCSITAGKWNYSMGFSMIEEYANSCALEDSLRTYFRIDAAHFIKNYAKILKDVSKRVRRFLLASLGQLIMSTTINHFT